MLYNRTRKSVLAKEILRAGSFFTRLRGLLWKRLPDNAALVIEPCRAVHTCFMQYLIGVLFVTGERRVVCVAENMMPYCFTPVVGKARTVVEMAAGRMAASGTRPGDILVF